MRTAPVIVLVASLLCSFPNDIPGESRLPRCEPRSNVDPARLNIDSAAEEFAVAHPCRAALHFYIQHNSNLGRVEGRVDFSHFEGGDIGSDSDTQEFKLELTAAEAGMRSETVELAPVEGHMCREFLVHLSGLACRDGEGREIECPDVRLKTSYVFEDFTIDTEGFEICFD